MHPFPHEYRVHTSARPEGDVTVAAEDLPALAVATPPEFGGGGGRWSPETLLVAAVADCFVLTFRAIAAASKLPWNEIACSVRGTLDRAEDGLRFTAMHLSAQLVVPPQVDAERARRLLEKSERGCLVTNSLKLTPSLEAEVTHGDAAAPA